MSRNILHYFGSSAAKNKQEGNKIVEISPKTQPAKLQADKPKSPSKPESLEEIVRKPKKSKEEQALFLDVEVLPNRSSTGIQNYFKKVQKANEVANDIVEIKEDDSEEDFKICSSSTAKKTYNNKRKRKDLKKGNGEDKNEQSEEIDLISSGSDERQQSESKSKEETPKSLNADTENEQKAGKRKSWSLRIKFQENTEETNKPVTESSEEDIFEEEAGPRRSSRIHRKRFETPEEETEEVAEKKRKRRQRRISSDDDEIEIVGGKVAPIFLKRQKQKEMKVVKQATLDFLHSGIPEALKQQIESQNAVESREVEIFPKVSHVLQRDLSEMWSLEFPQGLNKFLRKSDNNEAPPQPGMFKLELDLHADKKITKRDESRNEALTWKQCKEIINNVKTSTSLNFPYFRTFRTLLKQKNQLGEGFLESLPWTEVYQPKSSSEVLCEKSTALHLKRWLLPWCPGLKEQAKKKNKKKKEKNQSKRPRIDSSDSENESEFDQLCEYRHSRSDEDEEEQIQNTVLLAGPPGSGKTALVYALASELGLTVLEVNASSRRSCKQVLAQLQEATQSHTLGSSAATASKFFSNKQKTTSADPIQSGLSLILFEDVDLILEAEDESFYSAVSTIMSSSKRPIIMTVTTSSSSSEDFSVSLLQEKIRGSFDVLHCPRPKADIACAYLWTLCLAEGCYINLSNLRTFLEQQGISTKEGVDLRTALLQLELQLNNCPQQQQLSFSQLDIKEIKGSSQSEIKENGSPDAEPIETLKATNVSPIEPVELPTNSSLQVDVFQLAKMQRYVYNEKTNTVETNYLPKRNFSRILLDDSLYEADSDDQSAKEPVKEEQTNQSNEALTAGDVNSSTASLEALEHASRVLELVIYSDVLSTSCCSFDPDFVPTTNRVSGLVDELPDLTVALSWRDADIQKELQRTLKNGAIQSLANGATYKFVESVVHLSFVPSDFVPLPLHLRPRVRAADYEPFVRFHLRAELENFAEKQKKKRSSRNAGSSQLNIRPFDMFLKLDELVHIANEF